MAVKAGCARSPAGETEMITEEEGAAPSEAAADEDAAWWMAFRNVTGIGPVRFERLLGAFGSMRGVCTSIRG